MNLIGEEVWKPVAGFEGRYEISTWGNLRENGNVIKPTFYKKGYSKVKLKRGFGWIRHISLHGLVMETFVGPRPPDFDIHHIDENPRNNRLDNLRYVNHWEHIRIHNGETIGDERELNQKEIDLILENASTRRGTRRKGEKRKTTRELAEILGVSRYVVWRVASRPWRHKAQKRAPSTGGRPRIKFTPEEVEHIRINHHSGPIPEEKRLSVKELSEMYGVSGSLISRIQAQPYLKCDNPENLEYNL